MVNSVEALLDDAADARIRAEWAELEACGMPNQGRHSGSSNRPHITMAVAGTMDAILDRRLRVAVGDLPLPIEIGELTCFGRGPFVLVRLVELTPDLLARQCTIAEVVGLDNLEPLVRPDVWTPHVTLARRLTANQVEMATNRLENRVTATGPATVTGVRRWDGDAKREWLLAGEDGRHD
jgi:2'-5' RNA ligase